MSTKCKYTIALVLALLQAACFATGQRTCETSRSLKYSRGELSKTTCSGFDGTGSYDAINFNGKPVLSDVQLFRNDFAPDLSKWVYASGEPNPSTGCAPRLYLIDFSLTPPKVLAFGVKGACNEFHWASWSEKRSVIALKHNVRFTYENGQMTLPEKGEKLWRAIEPPHAGPGLSEEEAIPFVQEVPPPK